MTTTTEMKPVLHTLMRGGSPSGLSHWLKWLDCPKAAWLNEKADSPERRAEFAMSYSGALVGIIGHALMEMYWKSKLGPQDWAAIRYTDGAVDPDARAEAQKCVEALLNVIREDGAIPIGPAKLVSCEEELALPEDKAQELIGASPFSMRDDLVLELDKSHVAALKSCIKNVSPNCNGAVECLKPGFWMFDYKFYSRRDSNLLDRSLGSTQFTAYQAVWNHLHPAQQLAGLIQITVFNTKEHNIVFTVVPPPSEDSLAVVVNLLAQAHVVATTVGPIPKPLEHNCYPYGKVCPFLLDGQCKRY